MLVAMAGALVILAGIALTGLQLYVSIRDRAARIDRTGDPWNGRTLEWSIASPPPPWNFSVLPHVEGADAYWGMKQAGLQAASEPEWRDIHLPRSTPIGGGARLLRDHHRLRHDLAHLVAGDRRHRRPDPDVARPRLAGRQRDHRPGPADRRAQRQRRRP
jgi:hypothetical protein